MRHLLPLSAVFAATTAFAQPVTRPEIWNTPRPEMRAETCGVTFVRAPDEVRYAIEHYLRDEPRCSSSIELRVVPTEGGFYLLAQRPDGRIHERLVPDLQSAGVLVASWVADDWTAPPATYVLPTPAPSAPLAATVHAPGATSVVASAAPRDTKWHKWLSLGLAVQPDNEGGGFRFEADLLSSGAWRFGAMLGYSQHGSDISDGNWMYGSLNARDITVMAQLSRTATWGRWELRAALGVGVINTEANFWGETYTSAGWSTYQGSDTFAVGEASALVTRRIGRSWGIAMGPVLTFINESFTHDSISETLTRRTTQVEIFGGLRYEL